MVEVKRARKRSALDAAIEAIRDHIVEQGLEPGDPLATELELCEQLGFSRITVREAMRHFRTLGMIESKPRVGAVIQSLIPVDPFAGYVPFLAADPKATREVAEMRMALECGAGPLMVAKCSNADIDFLAAQLDGLTSPGDYLEAEIAFHTRLLEMTGNRLIHAMVPLTKQFFDATPPHARRRQHARQTVAMHQAIIDALAARSIPDLVNALHTHYSPYFS